MLKGCILIVSVDIPGTLKLTASLHLKMDGWSWNTIVSFSDGLFSGAMFQGVYTLHKSNRNFIEKQAMP